MTEAVVDHALRRRALDVGESFIVQAPAGSGKTELLIQRYLTLLGRVDSPESVVAITFTRKAAGEMRHRIVDALADAENRRPVEPHKQHTRSLARAALRQDQVRGWRLREFPARLRIQTIDSLCGALVAQMPWVSRMGAAPVPEERTRYLYRRAARETLALLEEDGAPGEAVDRLLRHLDNDVRVLEDLLVGMLACRDQWLRHVAGDTGSARFRASLESDLAQVGAQQRARLRSMFTADQVASVLEIVRFAVDHLPGVDSRSPLARLAAGAGLPGTGGSGDVEEWEALARFLLTDDGRRRRRVDRRHGFPPTDAGRAAIARFRALELDDAILDKLHEVRYLPPARFSDDQWLVLEALASLLPLAAAHLKVVFREEGRVDFTEMAHAARMALGTPDAPTDLGFALDCRIQHLLVDEFQDTSETQYELLEALTAEWVPGDGRTLFLVGDPMQSIYAFRQADVGLFLKVRDDGIGNLRPEPLTLSVNFRSDGGIVDWINRALPPAFARQEDLLTGAVEYVPSVAYHPEREGAGVRVHPFDDENLAAEADRVLDLVRSELQADPGRTIAVLVRARAHLTEIMSVLRANDIRFQAVEIDSLERRPIVQDLLALTRALLDPADRTAWLAVLRAPWCGLRLEDLDSLIGSDFEAAVWDLMSDPRRLARLTPDGGRRLERVVSALGPVLPLRGRVPLRRWVETAWLALGGPATADGSTDLEDATACLDLLTEMARGAEPADAGAFREAVEGLFGRPDVGAGPGLQLLTVHKAKGLEFDTVILPGLGRTIREEEQQLMLWLEHAEEVSGSGLLLAPVKARGSDPDPTYQYLARVQRKKAENEESRLLYVAATRARKRLHLLGHTRVSTATGATKPPAARSLLSKIWSVVESDFIEARKVSVRSADSRTGLRSRVLPPPGLRRLRPEWVPPPDRPDVVWNSRLGLDQTDLDSSSEEASESVRFDWATDLRRRIGTVVHALLQQSVAGGRRDPSGAWERGSIRAALEAEGVSGEALDAAADRVAAALDRVLDDPRGRWILASHEDDRREFGLSGLLDGRVRRGVLDRTFVEDGIRWIIDYKTGMHEGGGLEAFLDSEERRYRAQLEEYGRLMSGIEDRPIRLGLYFPMFQGWREWALAGSLAGVDH